MSPAPSADYGTNDPRAFAHFVAGLFAEGRGRLDAAAELYTAAMRLDPDYHKALNNRGLLMQADGARLFVERTDDTRARQLLEDAAELFARAKVLKSIAEYHYNYATTLSYLGRLDRRSDRNSAAQQRHRLSIVAYNEALAAVDREIESVDLEPRGSWWSRRPSVDADRQRAERQAFKRSVQLALAISCVLARELEGELHPLPEEKAAIDDVLKAFVARSRVSSHPRLEYNLACYYAVTKNLTQAVSLFRTLRVKDPDLARRVLADPDLADIPEITSLFTAGAAAGSPRPQPPPLSDDDPDRDEPT